MKIAGLFLILLTAGSKSIAQRNHTLHHSSIDTVIVQVAITHEKMSDSWKAALTSRMTREELDSVSRMTRPLTAEEKDWIALIRSKTGVWNRWKDSLVVPFAKIQVPDTVYILTGYQGLDDAFTYQLNTVCFDVTAMQKNYGMASLAENSDRINRVFAHEFTHLLHKAWAKKNNYVPVSFRDSILWECLYEGIGMYRSLAGQWLPKNGVLPAITQTALDELYPIFTERIAALRNATSMTAEEKIQLNKNLSRGPVNKKWGAFTVAIWLALEAQGNDKNLARYIQQGPASVLLLAKKHLPQALKARL